MIIDFTVENFRSFQGEQTLSMNVEGGRERHNRNFTLVEEGKLAVLRSAAILGANASGKSNLLMAILALKWLVVSSYTKKDEERIRPYEPFRLSSDCIKSPTKFEMEFVVPSGIRYLYSVSFDRNRILSESLHSFSKRQPALIFERTKKDTWETIKFGGTYKGGSRKFPVFPNQAYLSRAGNDASSPKSIQEVFRYFRNIMSVGTGVHVKVLGYLDDPIRMKAISNLICLADTGVSKVTLEENDTVDEIRLPDDMPEALKEMVLDQNRSTSKFWMEANNGELIEFDEDDMSDGTIKLYEILPLILNSLSNGSPLLIDEIDAHLHTHLLDLLLQLFHDHEINTKGAQLIFTTHDTNVLNSNVLRRDQIWFVSKEKGASTIRGLEEYDKKYVRLDSPFEDFYKDGRLGALPNLPYSDIKKTVIKAVSEHDKFIAGFLNA